MDAIEGTSYWTGAYLEWLDADEQQRLDGFREALDSVASELHVLESRIVALRESALSARAA